MEKLAIAVESDYLGSDSAQVNVLLNGETDVGQKLSRFITEIQRLDDTRFAVCLAGYAVNGWQSEWINHCTEGRSLLHVKFVKPRGRKVDAQAFLDFVNAHSVIFIRQLELTLEARVDADRQHRLELLNQAAEEARDEALQRFYKDIKRDAIAACGVADILRMLMEETSRAAKATTAAERQALLDQHIARQVDRLSKLSCLEGVPQEKIEAALKMSAPVELPEWIGQLTLLNF